MLRDPQGFYKWGRATPKSGILTKIKRWEDAEARILSTYEEMHNGNEAKTNALGKTERSSHKDNKTGAGRLGGYVCETYRRLDCDLFTLYPDQSVPVERIEFDLGAAANTTQEARARAFATRDSLVGKIIKFKYQRTEGAEKPRFNSAISIRADE
jgi:DNA ligase-1